jgi:hypothetical protein
MGIYAVSIGEEKTKPLVLSVSALRFFGVLEPE